MRPAIRAAAITIALLTVTLAFPKDAMGQGRGHGNSQAAVSTSSSAFTAAVSISLGDRDIIRQFYSEHTRGGLKALPPGIRRNLERGKPLPPGIAKQVAPSDLASRIHVPDHFEIVEVGLDVLLVEVATGIIHDVLMDVIR